jgi:hypothetical protein
MAQDSIFLSKGATVAFGVIKDDEFEKVSDDVTIEKEPESDGGFECSAQAEYPEGFVTGLDLGDGRDYLAVHYVTYPKTSLKRSRWWYTEKYLGATSIRRARKFARVIGCRDNRGRKDFFRGVEPCSIVCCPHCKLETILDKNGVPSGYKITSIPPETSKNEKFSQKD